MVLGFNGGKGNLDDMTTYKVWGEQAMHPRKTLKGDPPIVLCSPDPLLQVFPQKGKRYSMSLAETIFFNFLKKKVLV